MTASPRATAELRKLAHALDVEPAALDVVSGLPPEDLRALRKQIGEALFQADRHYFARMAALTKAVPGAVSAKLTEAVVPPLIAARTAELLEPRRAVELVGRISEKYLADVSAYLDAARVPELVAAMPAERIAAVAAELARREEWIVIGGFVAEVTSDALAASVAAFNGEQLLRIGFVLDDLSRLDDIGDLLTEAQIDELLAAAPEFGLWLELRELLEHLEPPRVERLAQRYAAAPAALRSAYQAATKAGDLAQADVERLAAG